MDIEKLTAHVFTHLLKHGEVHPDQLHQSLQDEHDLRDEEMPMVHEQFVNLLSGWNLQGMLIPMPSGFLRLSPPGHEEALQFLDQHGYPPPR